MNSKQIVQLWPQTPHVSVKVVSFGILTQGTRRGFMPMQSGKREGSKGVCDSIIFNNHFTE